MWCLAMGATVRPAMPRAEWAMLLPMWHAWQAVGIMRTSMRTAMRLIVRPPMQAAVRAAMQPIMWTTVRSAVLILLAVRWFLVVRSTWPMHSVAESGWGNTERSMGVCLRVMAVLRVVLERRSRDFGPMFPMLPWEVRHMWHLWHLRQMRRPRREEMVVMRMLRVMLKRVSGIVLLTLSDVEQEIGGHNLRHCGGKQQAGPEGAWASASLSRRLLCI